MRIARSAIARRSSELRAHHVGAKPHYPSGRVSEECTANTVPSWANLKRHERHEYARPEGKTAKKPQLRSAACPRANGPSSNGGGSTRPLSFRLFRPHTACPSNGSSPAPATSSRPVAPESAATATSSGSARRNWRGTWTPSPRSSAQPSLASSKQSSTAASLTTTSNSSGRRHAASPLVGSKTAVRLNRASVRRSPAIIPLRLRAYSRRRQHAGCHG